MSGMSRLVTGCYLKGYSGRGITTTIHRSGDRFLHEVEPLHRQHLGDKRRLHRPDQVHPYLSGLGFDYVDMIIGDDMTFDGKGE